MGSGRAVLNIVVRSRRDAAAVEAMVSRFYSDWVIRIYTLHGARRGEDMLRELESFVDRDRFYYVLLGREDKEAADYLTEYAPENVFVHIVPRARVRNARIEHIAHELLVARSIPRLSIRWRESDKSYLFLEREGRWLEGLEFDPGYDFFWGLGWFSVMSSQIIGNRLPRNPLVLRRRLGEHFIYSGERVIAKLFISDSGSRPSGKYVSSSIDEVYFSNIDFKKMIEVNRNILALFERIAVEFLKNLGDFDTIIVPWSGGKDSTATLLIALEAFGRSRVHVVYGDTGTEFPLSRNYVYRIAGKLGIDFIEAYAGIDKVLEEGVAPMPTHDNRWCTGMKVDSIENTIKKLADGRTLIIVGDRDAESPKRAMRPYVRRGPVINSIIATPIREWSGALVQLYIMYKGLPLNPMYEYGFYRIGCYMCPALRNWEIFLMTNNFRLHSQLSKSKIFQEFIKLRLASRETEQSRARFTCSLGDERLGFSVCGG